MGVKKTILNRILDWGTKEEISLENQRTRMLNGISLIVLALNFLYLIPILILKQEPLYLQNITGYFIFAFPLVLNRLGWARFARAFFCIGPGLFFTFHTARLGGQTGLEYTLVILSVVPFLFFANWKLIIPIFLLHIGEFFGVMEYLKYYPPAQPWNDYAFFAGNILSLFVVLFILVLFFKNESAGLRMKMERKNQVLKSQANELRQFYYAVSHDLKSPVRGLSNLLDFVEEDYGKEIPNHIFKHFQLIRMQIARLDNLTQGILEYSAIDARMSKFRSLDLRKPLEELADRVNTATAFQLSLAPELPDQIVANELFKQVFFELVENAMKFHTEQEGKIHIGCASQDQEYLFWVEDDGPGIPAQFHDRIFELFETLEPKSKSGYAGAGLAIVKKVVQTCGGRLWLESTEGKGSTFFFTLPYRQQ